VVAVYDSRHVKGKGAEVVDPASHSLAAAVGVVAGDRAASKADRGAAGEIDAAPEAGVRRGGSLVLAATF
jgi:hypothetical protein